MEGRSSLLSGEDRSSSKEPILLESSISFAGTNMIDAQQGAQAVPEFKIRVKASEPLDERVHFLLRVKYESFHFSCGVTYSSIEHIEERLTKTHNYSIQVSQDLSTCTSDPCHRRARRSFQNPSKSSTECDQDRRSESSWRSNGFSGMRTALIAVDISRIILPTQLVTFSQEWITNHHTLSTEGATKLSLAEEMENRATQQQRVSHSPFESF